MSNDKRYSTSSVLFLCIFQCWIYRIFTIKFFGADVFKRAGFGIVPNTNSMGHKPSGPIAIFRTRTDILPLCIRRPYLHIDPNPGESESQRRLVPIQNSNCTQIFFRGFHQRNFDSLVVRPHLCWYIIGAFFDRYCVWGSEVDQWLHPLYGFPYACRLMWPQKEYRWIIVRMANHIQNWLPIEEHRV